MFSTKSADPCGCEMTKNNAKITPTMMPTFFKSTVVTPPRVVVQLVLWVLLTGRSRAIGPSFADRPRNGESGAR